MIDSVTRLINRHAALLWLVLIGSLGAAALLRVDPLPEGVTYGRGSVGLDILAAIWVWMAGAMLVIVRAGSRGQLGIVALADWLQLLALSLAGVRLITMLAVNGDAYVSVTAILSLLAFATSSMCYSLGRLMRMGGV